MARSVLPVPALPDDGDQPDLVVEQQVEREGLLLVARPDPPDALLGHLDERDEGLPRRAVLADRRVLRVRAVAQHDEGVGRRRLRSRRGERHAARTRRTRSPARRRPRPRRRRSRARRAPPAPRRRSPPRGARARRRGCGGSCPSSRRRWGSPSPSRGGRAPPPGSCRRWCGPRRRRAAASGPRGARGCAPCSGPMEHALPELPLDAELVEVARDLAGVAAQRREVALEVVDLLDHVDRDDDVVVVEPEDAARIVEQDVGVEDEVLFHDRCGSGEVEALAAARGESSRGRRCAARTPATLRFRPSRFAW